MAYDRTVAGPSDEAHDAAAALDTLIEAVSDGIDITDVGALFKLEPFLSYITDAGGRGEAISRVLQVVSLLDRDNALLNSNI